MIPLGSFQTASQAVTDEEFKLQVQELMDTSQGHVDASVPSEIAPAPAPLTPAPTGGSYSHSAMIDLMVQHPEYSHEQFAAAFGRRSNWFASVLANESFQRALEPRKHEVADPSLTATMDERMRALSLQALDVLQLKLEAKGVNEQTVLKAVEIATKALGMGSPLALAPPVVQVQGAEAVADRIMEAMAQARARQQAAVNKEAIDVEVKVVPNGS